MKISFRQGIVRYQTDINAQPTFLQKSTLDSQFIDLVVSPDPTVITFAHRDANYLFEEAKTVAKAWGPFTGSATQYLYWDINVLTAQLTRGATLFPPIFSGTPPVSPVIDQHWFDLSQNLMRVWNGNKWLDKIRVFAATYSSSAVIRPYALGTQVGLNVQNDVGQIVLDSFAKPLRQSDGSFLTSTAVMSVVGMATKKVKVEAELLHLLANENIARFNCVQARQGRRAALARSGDIWSRVAGVAMEDMYQGETSEIVTQGLIRSDTMAWPADKVNRPLFCGPAGELTTTPPMDGVLQQVGSVYDTDAVYINIYPPIILDNPYGSSVVVPPPPVGSPVPVIGVSPNIRVGQAPLLVNFVNASTGGPFSAVEWDFTNDGTIDSTLANPQYTYSTPGTYNVRLRVTNGAGTVEKVEVDYITVQAAAPPAGFTNLEVRFVVDGHEDTEDITVKKGQTFGVKVRVKNDGLLTATNVQRVFVIYDVANQPVQMVTPPTGATVTRGANFTQITFLPIASMASNSVVDFPPFVMRAPTVGTKMQMEAAVSSPEADSTSSDNTRALTVKLMP